MLERRPLRAIGLTSYALGYASVIFGYSLLCHFIYISAYYILDDRTRHGGPSWRVVLFDMTSPGLLACLLGWMGVAAVLGGIGYALVYPLPRNGRHTLIAAAARITAAGLVGAALDLVFLSLMLGYRAYRLFG
jgi:hypothetical protein